MAKDFKASQIRTTQIIASGSTIGKPSLVILSASSPGVDFDGSGISSVPSAVGRDVFVFVSGSTNSFGTSTRGVTLFGGDIVVSGSLYNGLGGSYGNVAGSNTQIQFNDGGNFGADNGLTYNKTTKTLTIGNLIVTGASTVLTSTNLTISDQIIYLASGTKTLNTDGGIAIASGSSVANQSLVWGRVANDTWGAGRLDVVSGTLTSLTSMALVPVRSSKLELGGSNSFVSSSVGTDLMISATSVQITGTLSQGNNSQATGDSSHSEGAGTKSTGNYSHAEGDSTVAAGSASHAEGIASTAVGEGSHSEGASTTALGDYAHSQGNSTVAYGAFSFAAGQYTIASGTGQTVVGQYNKRNNDTSLFVVGNGTGDGNVNRKDIFLVDQNTVRIGSGSNLGSDVFLFISGTAGTKDSSVRGTSLFQGDVVISGTLHGGSPLKVSGSMALSGSLRLQTQDSAPSVGTSESVLYVLDSGGTKKLYWKNSDGVQQQVGTGGGSSSGTFNEVNSGGTISLVTTASVSLAGAKGFNYGVNQVGSDAFFFVSGSTSSRGSSSGEVTVFGGHTVFSGALFGGVNPDLGRTLLRHEASQISFSKEEGLAAGSVTGTDIFMFVSGAIGSKGTAVRGTTVYGGDIVISGVLHGGSPLQIGSNTEITGTLNQGTGNLVSGNRSVALGLNNNVSGQDSTAIGSYNIVQGDYGFAAGAENKIPASAYSAAAFGQRVVASGSVLAAGICNTLDNPNALFVVGNGANMGGELEEDIRQDILVVDTNMIRLGSGSKAPTDTFLSVYGVPGSKGSATRGTAVFRGDTVVSGVLYSSKISGSLTQLTDGTPYLIAGSNITLTTGTNGAVTIASTGGGTPGGSDTQIQFNDGGSFGGNNGLKYDKNTQTLSVGNLIVTGSTTVLTSTNVTISDQMIYLASGSKVSNTNGGIAITSGSSASNQALVWGRVANDTWGAGRQDVTAGTTSDLTTMTLVPVRSSKFEIGGSSAFVSSSNGSSLEIGAATQVLVLSGGATSSPNPRNFVDTNFFVSGSIATATTTTRGVAVFGGDTFVSGQIFFGGDISQPTSISRMLNSGQIAYWQNWYSINPTINVAGKFGASLAQFQVIATQQNISGKLRVGHFQETATAYLHITQSSGAASTAPIKLQSGSLLATPEAGAIEFNGTNLFITSGTTRQTFLTTLANNAAVTSSFLVSTASNMTLRVPGAAGDTVRSIIMTSDRTPTPAVGDDAFIFVSGSTSSKGTSTRGTAVFGGDVVISGTLHGGVQFGSSTGLTIQANKVQVTANTLSFGQSGGSDVGFFVSGAVGSRGVANSGGAALLGGDLFVSGVSHFSSGLSGSLTRLTDGTSYLIAGANVTITTGTNGAVTIASIGGGSGVGTGFNDGGNTLNSTSSVAFAGLLGDSYYVANVGSDTFFFVSGSVGSKNTSQRGVAVFGGDLLASGNTIIVGATTITGALTQGAQLTASGQGSHAQGIGSRAEGSYSHAEGYFTTARASYSHAEGMGTIASGTGQSVVGKYNLRNNNTSLFIVGNGSAGDDPSRSDAARFETLGTYFFNDTFVTGTVRASTGISGSLTRLTDGTSYLIAGANVTITTGSSGAVTIASTGGGGGDSFFSSTTNGSIFTSGSAAFRGLESSIDSPADKGSDVFFYVSGTSGGKGSALPSVTLFGGDIVSSGTIYPGTDLGSNLGSPTNRFGNIYTGDLHLRNERGDWTIVEEEDYLCVVNNKTGKKFKMALIPLEE